MKLYGFIISYLVSCSQPVFSGVNRKVFVMIKTQSLRWLHLALLSTVVVLSSCGEEQASWEGAPGVAEVVIVEPRPFTLERELPGRIEPVRVAEVRARVAGIVLHRHFEEGADVEAGETLFTIDPAPFKAALSRAEGELAGAEAELFEADSVIRRYESLVNVDAVSRQDFDRAQAALRRAQAARQSALALVETAKLDLNYATVKAPISGRIGRALVTEGALVGQGEVTSLALIQQLDPVYVDFKQPVAEVLRLRTALEEGRLEQYEGRGARIGVSVEGLEEARYGHLLFSDITVDRGTGQVSLRGEFANPDTLLLPGMYARVHISQGKDPEAILIPQRAVRRSNDGSAQVMVVGDGDVVEARAVETGATEGSDWHIVAGLRSGDRVIVGGAAQPGAQVRVVEVAAPGTE